MGYIIPWDGKAPVKMKPRLHNLHIVMPHRLSTLLRPQTCALMSSLGRPANLRPCGALLQMGIKSSCEVACGQRMPA